MDNHFECPICFEIPSAEIYQCTNGHTICSECSVNIKSCPECRVPYGNSKIRNRALEQILDKQTFPCVFKEKGCSELCKRQDVDKHGLNCYYNPDSKTAVRLCQKLGFDDCKFILRGSSRSEIIRHFQEDHSFPVENGSSVIIHYGDFKAVTDPMAAKDSNWPPTLLCWEFEGPLVLLLGKVDLSIGSALWNGVCVWEIEDFLRCFILEFSLQNHDNLTKPVDWKIPLLSLEEAEESLSLWTSSSVMCYDFTFICKKVFYE
ncbi:unnamed protein product [Orchesella dallaii]|uniref:RING-type E3 ubiquitin transferase n=1 Tax=Orchesella dallaii TaxID=48710 RepID=A0ABP1QCV9_9HEXA